MPGSGMAELIFIAAMMVLILVISFAAVFFFMKTYRMEMSEKEKRRKARSAEADKADVIVDGGKGVNGHGAS
jgi:uncharacterized protein YpmB